MVHPINTLRSSFDTLSVNGLLWTRNEVMAWTRTELQSLPPCLQELAGFLQCWWDETPWMEVHTSGSTGVPKRMQVTKEQMIQSAALTCRTLGLQAGQTALLCMNLRYIGAMMMVVRALTAKLKLIVREASGHPLSTVNEAIDFAAMVPLQVYNSLEHPQEKQRLSEIRSLIIGGAAIDSEMEARLQTLSGAVYVTYGMTETLSHIALRRINGVEASNFYRPLAGVTVSLSPTDSTLCIHAPHLCDEVIRTRDVASINPNGSFRIHGRLDNVINSGGIKIQIEELEQRLRPLLGDGIAVTHIPDGRLGQAVVLLVAGQGRTLPKQEQLKSQLPRFHSPAYVLPIEQLPLTPNGKIDRAACRDYALKATSSTLPTN